MRSQARTTVPELVGAASVSLFIVVMLLARNITFNVDAATTTPVYLILTVLFITSGSILVAYVSGRAYLRRRLPSMLFLGAAALTFGLTSLVASISNLMSSGKAGTNGAATVFIIGVSLSAIAHLASVGSRRSGDRSRPGAPKTVAVEFALVAIAVLATTAVAFSGMLPTFFVPGGGATPVAQSFLVLAILGMAFAAGVVVRPSLTSPVLGWYCSALGVTAVGLTGILLSDWIFEDADFIIGRTALSVAGLFLILSLRSAETIQPLDPDSALKEIFNPLVPETKRKEPQPRKVDPLQGDPSLYERSMLLEANPSSNYERAIERFAEEMVTTGRIVFIFTSKGSPVHSLLREVEGARFFVLADVSYPKASGTTEVLVPATDLSVMLSVVNEIVAEEQEPKKAIVFDNISPLILEKGFGDVYKFLKQMNEMVTGGDVVSLVIMLEGAHDEKTVNLVRNLYAAQLAYDSSGLRSRKLR